MLKLYNSLTRSLEEFKPLRGKTVTMYNCGPTVYDYAHIGNLRTYLFADVLRRWLENSGYKVKQVRNITDVGHMLHDADVGEDKLEAAARKESLDPIAIARKYEKIFFEDISKLNLLPAWKNPRASEHVTQMIAMISRLLKKGIAYRSDGDVYYDIAKFPAYGSLSGNSPEALKAGARIEASDKKRHPLDFALWIHNPAHVLQWDAPWSRGYPGWHIECSAMSIKYLGETIDIHTGAEDNKFPHHECEIAQSEGVSGKPFVRFWMHAAHLLVDGDKMSKSRGNFYRLDDLLSRGYEPRAIRYAFIASHYRDQQNFTFASLDAAKSALSKIDALSRRLGSRIPAEEAKLRNDSVKPAVDAFLRDFSAAMDDDLNVPKALGALFIFVRQANSALNQGAGKENRASLAKVLSYSLEDVLGLIPGQERKKEAPAEVYALLAQREEARKSKDFARADELRAKINSLGYEIKDGPEGPELTSTSSS